MKGVETPAIVIDFYVVRSLFKPFFNLTVNIIVNVIKAVKPLELAHVLVLHLTIFGIVKSR